MTNIKILSFTAEGVLAPWSLVDIQAALRKAGHQVLVLDIAAMRNYQDKFIAITDALVLHQPDMIFTIDQIGLIPAILAVLEKPAHIAAWFFDDPFAVLKDDFQLINSRLHFHVWDMAYIGKLRDKGYINLNHQPFAANPAVFKPLPDAGIEYDFDVSFVGGASPARRDILAALAARGIRVDVFGDAGWQAACQPNLIYHGMASNRTDCPRIFNRSKINLNITSKQLITAVPLRVFDVLACGGFMLTDYREDTARLFKDGEELVVYKDIDDLAALIKLYLQQTETRQKIGTAGRQRVLQQYTFDKIVPEILAKTLRAKFNPAMDATLLDSRRARMSWCVALSCMKFGIYDQACRLLTHTLKEYPDNADVLLAMTALATWAGQATTAKACVQAIENLNGRQGVDMKEALALIESGERGKKANCWQSLYRGLFPDTAINLQPDGTIPGGLST